MCYVFNIARLISLGLVLLVSSAIACDSEEMLTDEFGLIQKVVAGSDKIKAFTSPGDGKLAYQMELLEPYFVICEEGQFFKITDAQAESIEEAKAGNVAYVSKHQVHRWTTREALAFSDLAFLEERPKVVAWSDEESLKKFMDSGNKKLYPPAFQEELPEIKRRETALRPYPVLDSDNYKIRKKVDKSYYEVLIPADLPPTSKLVFTDDTQADKVESVLKAATIVIVFDATGSMADFALETADSIISAVESLSREVLDNTKMGFVFYRDKEDSERLVEIAPLPVRDAVEGLRELAKAMDGGGDAAEPILDATYHAIHLYPWFGDSGQQTSGKRILIGVLNQDAHQETIGLDENKGDKIPFGLGAVDISTELSQQSIPMITVQAGPNAGDYLESVLQTLATGSNGDFIRWDAGDTQASIANAVTNAMTTEAKEAVARGSEVISGMKKDLEGRSVIALNVMDGEMLDRLRKNGIDFNIDTDGGVLVRKGYILESDDLLAPKFQIEKDTLQELVNLYSILGNTSMDSESFKTSAGQALSAIVGEKYDSNENVSDLIQKKLGIKFTSGLLDFNLEYLDTLNTNERLKYGARIQEGGNSLGQFLEANLSEFDTSPSVWVETAQLP